MRLSRPVYESVPLIYLTIGLCGFLLAYVDPARTRSVVAFCIGLIAAIAALTVFLHRHDYRDLSREYTGGPIDFPSSLGG
jgi:hypothetical protein